MEDLRIDISALLARRKKRLASTRAQDRCQYRLECEVGAFCRAILRTVASAVAPRQRCGGDNRSRRRNALQTGFKRVLAFRSPLLRRAPAGGRNDEMTDDRHVRAGIIDECIFSQREPALSGSGATSVDVHGRAYRGGTMPCPQ
jgi:hypothetical protein